MLHVAQKSFESYFEDDTDNGFCYFENDTENVCKQDLMYLDHFSIWCIKYHKSGSALGSDCSYHDQENHLLTSFFVHQI